MSKRLTHEEFLEKFHQKNEKSQNIIVEEKYVNNNTKLRCNCKVCGFKWYVTPTSLFNGCGCPRCSGQYKTDKEFKEKVNSISPNIILLTPYISCKDYIKCKCSICENEWSARADNLMSGKNCPKCALKKFHRKAKSNTNFIKDLQLKFPNLITLDEYINKDVAIRFKCLNCGTIFKCKPTYILNRTFGCLDCSNVYGNLNPNEFKERIYNKNPNIVFLTEYKDYNTKILCKCKCCNFEWHVNPRGLQSGTGCPICNKSKGEKECVEYFIKNNIKFISQYEYSNLLGIGNRPLKFDFAIVNNNSDVLGLIEYDGIFHYKKLYDDDGYERLKIHDKRKNEYCQQHNLPLLRIPYWDFDNIENILNSFIKNISQLDCEAVG